MKIKEKIQKIGNRKHCLLLALFILALLFSVLMPKINLGTQKASALSSPQEKTLDLNGESYSYQTSLNELKNNYGIFNYDYTKPLLAMHENSEGENHLTILSTTGLVSKDENNKIAELLKDNIKLYQNNVTLDNDFIYDNDSTDYPSFTWEGENQSEMNLSRLTKIEINFDKIRQIPLIDETIIQDYNGGLFIQLRYLKDTYQQEPQTLEENTIYKGYALSKSTNFSFNPIIQGYSLRELLVTYSSTISPNLTEGVYSNCLTKRNYVEYTNTDIYNDSYLTIENIVFLNNSNSNIINFDFFYDTSSALVSFKGTLLLSNDKYDNNLVDFFNNNITVSNIVQSFENPIFFGGYAYNTGKRVTNLYYHNFPGVSLPGGTKSDRTISGNSELTQNNANDNNTLFAMNFNFGTSTLKNIQYYNQNQLLFLEDASDLRINNADYDGAGLSAQVEDVLYNVEYLGNTDQIQQEEEIKKDLENMLYVTGAFAVIGLLLGFLFGNPILGLVLGAVVGFGLTIIPIVLDGLQAIFGQQFLDGLQNFFRSIASSIAGVVSSILSFLFNIITNPAVLVLVLIVAILYLFVFRKKD